MLPVEQLQEIISASNNIVFFGGAGVSTESGIPDFRSVDGLYNQRYKYPPEVMLSYTFYREHTAEFYDFYREKLLCPTAKPNAAHFKLAELEAAGKLKAVITQNIDGLHQMAGSKTVLELHGSVKRNYCQNCHAFYDDAFILQSTGVPTCECGGVIKPDVVLYEEGLAQETMQRSMEFIAKADVLIVGGTSLVVYPAAGMIDYYRGRQLVLINRGATHSDKKAKLLIQESIGEVLGQISLS
ncbi:MULTISPECIES: NAD-dependent protein deacylase [Sporomusaceae]|uniref:NAD-dependent protein deacylase n=1 Tax=Sporomusaceae TaxID=1843490 RepID=UPI00037CFBC8|nr:MULTISPECIES: NAD-dependent protein deacylase [Sporomusaceae]